MKNIRILAWLLVLCLLLTACTGETPADTSGSTAATGKPVIPTINREPPDFGDRVKFEMGGACTVPYTVNISTARYIREPEKLPDFEELKGYDAAWFQDHALVVVYETVSNPSLEVGIESIALSEGEAGITLTHTPGKNPGTTRKTTWLLWAEVEAGLDYTWTVLNPAEDSAASDT